LVRWGCEVAGRCGGAAYCSPCRTSTTGRTRCRSRGRNPRCRQCRKSRSSCRTSCLRGPRVGVRVVQAPHVRGRGRLRRTVAVAGPMAVVAAQVAAAVAVRRLVPIDIRSLRVARPGPAVIGSPAKIRAAVVFVFAVLFRCPRRVELAARDGVEARAPDLGRVGLRRVSAVLGGEAAHVRWDDATYDRHALRVLRRLLRLHVQGEARRERRQHHEEKMVELRHSTCGRRERRSEADFLRASG
jgi:hypothetical protein